MKRVPAVDQARNRRSAKAANRNAVFEGGRVSSPRRSAGSVQGRGGSRSCVVVDDERVAAEVAVVGFRYHKGGRDRDGGVGARSSHLKGSETGRDSKGLRGRNDPARCNHDAAVSPRLP